MTLLQELWGLVTEEVDNIPDSNAEEYANLPKNTKKTKKNKFPLSDKAENSLINNIWLYQNADAS